MVEKSVYDLRVEPHLVDFTMKATIPALGNEILNIAGVDAQRKGFGIDVLNKSNWSWVLSRMAIEIDHRPTQYAPYTITTWVNEYGRLLSTRNFTMADGNGREFGRAVTQWCMIDLTARTPVNLMNVGGDHLAAMVDAPSPCDKPRKILGVAPEIYSNHKVVYSDIDFNRHVNTMRYIDMMFDMLPIEMLAEERAMRMDIHFLHEARYGQTLRIGHQRRSDDMLFEITIDEGTVAVRASMEWK